MEHQAKETWIEIQGWDVKDSLAFTGLAPTESAPGVHDLTDVPAVQADEAATFTAIALAESGGNAGAHNPHGEDSPGLWQINASSSKPDVDPDTFDCSGLVQWASGNAFAGSTIEVADSFVFKPHAAAQPADQTTDISPWTVTHGVLPGPGGNIDLPQLMCEAATPEPNFDGSAVATLMDLA